MSVDIEARVRRANPLTHTEQLEQLFGEDTSSRLFRDIHHKREGRMPDTTGNQQPTNVQDRTPATRQKTEPRTPSRGPSRRRGLLVAAAGLVVAIIAAGVVIGLLGGSSDEPDVGSLQPGPITSFEDIAGTTYELQGPSQHYMHISENGIVQGASYRDLVEDRPLWTNETRFEGTKVFVNSLTGVCRNEIVGIYEFHVLENGNLQFVPIEDTCVTRSRTMRIGEFEPFLINP